METAVKTRRGAVPLYLDKKQIINLFSLLNEKDKLDAFEQIKRNVFINRFENLKKSLQNSELTFEEITAEVDAVRKERYESGRQML